MTVLYRAHPTGEPLPDKPLRGRRLSWAEFRRLVGEPIRRVKVTSIAEGEDAENDAREDFRPSERVAIAAAVEKEISSSRGGDTSSGEQVNTDNYPEWKGKEARVIATEKAGFSSGKQYERAATVVANGNTPGHADEFTDLAARRAWLAARPHKTRPVLVWPTLERLARQKKPFAGLLVRYRDLMAPPTFVAANDNNAPETDVDVRSEIRPSENELMVAAAADLIVKFSSAAEANNGWSIRAVCEYPVCFRGERATIGKLVFDRGALTSWGATKKGRTLRPVDRTRQPKGSKPPPRTRSSVRFLLRSDAPIAEGAGFLGGVTRPRGDTRQPDLGDFEAEIEFQRNASTNALGLAIGSTNQLVLDMAITDASAREIGEALGYCGKRAERQGMRAIDAALEKFSRIAA